MKTNVTLAALMVTTLGTFAVAADEALTPLAQPPALQGTTGGGDASTPDTQRLKEKQQQQLQDQNFLLEQIRQQQQQQAQGNKPTEPSAEQLPLAQTVNGELLQIEGENWVVRDDAGKEVRLHVDENTQKPAEAFKKGDTVQADLSPTGHANTISKVDRGNKGVQ